MFDENGRLISRVREQFFGNIVLTITIMFANLVVTYNIMSNYFQRNKQKLFLKNIFGYGTVKRNAYFISIFLIYNLVVLVCATAFLGIQIFVIAMSILLIDITVALTIEKKILSKSFNEVLKGEH